MTRYQFTQADRSRGGQKVAQRQPPDTCPHCNAPMQARKWHSYLGHLGLHGLADNWFNGDIEAAQKHLRENGLAINSPGPAADTYVSLPRKDVLK